MFADGVQRFELSRDGKKLLLTREGRGIIVLGSRPAPDDRVAVLDLPGFTKFEVTGPGAAYSRR